MITADIQTILPAVETAANGALMVGVAIVAVLMTFKKVKAGLMLGLDYVTSQYGSWMDREDHAYEARQDQDRDTVSSGGGQDYSSWKKEDWDEKGGK